MSTYQRRELEKLENKIIPDLESKKVDVESKLHSNSDDYEKLHQLTQELAKINENIDKATAKWMELSELS